MANHPSKLTGFSLVETLIAMALSLVLCLSIIRWWQNFAALNHDVMTTLQLTEKGRIAAQLLQHAILPAGYMGCIRAASQTQLISGSAALQLESGLAVKGYQASVRNWYPALPSHLVNKILPSSDVLAVYHAAKQTAVIVQMNHSHQELQIASMDSSAFKPGSSVIITNCSQATVTEITAHKNRTTLFLAKPLPADMTLPAEINLIDVSYYYLAQATGSDKNSDYPALWVTYYQPNKTQIRWQSDELEPDISGFKLKFWQKLSPTQTTLLSPMNVTDWHAVVGVEINLQVQAIGLANTTATTQQVFNQSWPVVVALRQMLSA